MMAYELYADMTKEEFDHIMNDMLHDYIVFGTTSCFIKPLKEKKYD